MTRAVLHVDMDAFYASVEQHDDPSLAGKPVVVGWDGGRGVVAAASYEVRRFGVRSAMPMRTARRLCPEAICVRPRMQRYQEVSGVVFGVFREVTPLVQGLSLDEAFLDVTASQELFGGAVDIARRLKQRIRALTGLTASVGVAPNKLVAKIASDLMKPDGLTVVPAERVREVLDPLSVRRLPGLGRKTGAKVEAAGLHTLGELRSAPDAVLWPLFGRYSAWMRERASGIDERPVLPEVEEKSLSAEDTFARSSASSRAWRAWPRSACARGSWWRAASGSRSGATISPPSRASVPWPPPPARRVPWREWPGSSSGAGWPAMPVRNFACWGWSSLN
jgi:DNA polymerase IV